MGTPITGMRIAVPGIKPIAAKHVIKGKVRGSSMSHDGQVRLEIEHGRRKAPKKQKGAAVSPFAETPGQAAFYNQPTSSYTLPANIAQHYPVGSHVHIGIAPAPHGAEHLQDEQDESDGES